jgi:hypothetical protein
MSTITNRIRILIALASVGAAVGCTSVASAAPNAQGPLMHVPIVVVHQPVATAYSHVGRVQGAGSAGIPGYDDAACPSLAQDNNTAVSSGTRPLSRAIRKRNSATTTRRPTSTSSCPITAWSSTDLLGDIPKTRAQSPVFRRGFGVQSTPAVIGDRSA